MIYLDNDSVITLAELDLIDLLCPALGISHAPHDIFCLRTAKRAVPTYCEDSASSNRAHGFLSQTGVVSEHLFGVAYTQINRLPYMDNEAALFACCANDPGTKAVTGDLKSVRSIAMHAPAQVQTALKGRVISTEQCILKILDYAGFATVSARWQGSPCQHLFFSTLLNLSEADVIAEITGRLNGCSADMKLLLNWP